MADSIKLAPGRLGDLELKANKLEKEISTMKDRKAEIEQTAKKIPGHRAGTGFHLR